MNRQGAALVEYVAAVECQGRFPTVCAALHTFLRDQRSLLANPWP